MLLAMRVSAVATVTLLSLFACGKAVAPASAPAPAPAGPVASDGVIAVFLPVRV